MELENQHPERSSVPQVQCCVCGLVIDSNPSNMCPNCLRAHVDITDDLQKEYILIHCPECGRYLQPPKYWARAELESRELLALCLKRVKGLNSSSGSNTNANKAKLVDAKFLWTEPHSKRIKLRLTVQKEVFNNIVIQQACVVEYVVTWQQCTMCQKVATGQPQWDACVQLRQKVSHKKTFLYLEQLILKKRLHENFIRIEAQPDGLDFFFAHKSHAMNFLEFLNKAAPVTRRDAVQLVSHDSKNNTAVQHFTFALDIAPLCREDLVLIPYKDYYLKSLGGMGPLVLVHKVFSSVVFLDPRTLRAGEITGSLYWKKPFASLQTSRDFVEFYVLECQLMPVTNGTYQLGLVTVCLSSEVGEGREWVTQSHLGGVLHPGDLVKGYLLEGRIFNNDDLDECRYKPEQLQDVILVRKHFPSQKTSRSRRLWKLKKLDIVTAMGEPSSVSGAARRNDGNNANDDEGEFEDEIERDAELRKDIAIYRLMDEEVAARREAAPSGAAAETEEYGDDELPEVALEEMLDELQVDEEVVNPESTKVAVDNDEDNGNEEVADIRKKKNAKIGINSFYVAQTFLFAGTEHMSPTFFSPRSPSSSEVACAPPHVSLYSQLEARLPVSPITPNAALKLLVCLFPALHHLGVVEHLVCIIRGNACCLDPSLCLSFMMRLLFPTLPFCFCRADGEKDVEDVLWSETEEAVTPITASLNDAAVRVTLTPLYETLTRCVMAHLRWQLEEVSLPSSHARSDPISQLWNVCPPHFASGKVEDARETDMARTSALLERGAALLLAFSAETSFLFALNEHGRLQHSDRMPCGISWQGSGCVSLICAVVQRLMEDVTADLEASHHTVPSTQAERLAGDLGNVATTDDLDWLLFCKVAQRCLLWSLLVCRATPILPSRALRAFVVDTLVKKLEELHRTIVSESENRRGKPQSVLSMLSMRPRQHRIASVEMLSLLLTRSLPVVNTGSTRLLANTSEALAAETRDTVHQTTCRHLHLWTTELRNALLMLSNDFAEVSIGLLNEKNAFCTSTNTKTKASESSYSVSMIASVALRLALQFAASAPHCTPTALSEVHVARRMLQAVSSLNLRIGIFPQPQASRAHSDADLTGNEKRPITGSAPHSGNDLSWIWIAEETWCKLACVQRFVLSKNTVTASSSLTGENTRVGSLPDLDSVDNSAVYAQLLRIGVSHLCHFFTFAFEGSENEEECTARCSEDSVSNVKSPMVPTIGSEPPFSLEFVFTLLRCWKAWINTRPDASCQDWLDDMAGCDAFSPLHQLSLWIVEAWVMALNVKSNHDPLDVCACWSALSTPSLVRQNAELTMHVSPCAAMSSLHSMHAIMCVCEQRLSRQCSDYLMRLRNVKSDLDVGESQKKCELRPRFYRVGERASVWAGIDASGDDAKRRWRPVFAPALISHAVLLLLHSGTFVRTAILPNAAADTVQLPLSETTLGELRRTIDSPLSTELTFFQLSMVSNYVRWCEAAAIHTGWCFLSVEDCRGDVDKKESTASTADSENTAQRTTNAPWFLLTVAGFVSSNRVHGKADTAALVYLWSLCDGAVPEAPVHKATVRTTSRPQNFLCGSSVWDRCSTMPYNESSCVVSPLSFVEVSHTRRKSCRPSACSSSLSTHAGSPSTWLRQAVDQWTRRYALRLVLFLLQEDAWQRYRKASSACQLAASPSPPHTINGMDPSRMVPMRSPSVNPSKSHANGMCTGALSPVQTTTTDHKRILLGLGDVVQPLLRNVARRLLSRVEELAAEMCTSRMLSQLGAQCTRMDAFRKITNLLHRLSGSVHHSTTRGRDSLAACVVAVLASIRDDESRSLCSTTSAFHAHLTSTFWSSAPRCSRLLSDEVRELEEMLQSLGLVTLINFTHARVSEKGSEDQAVEGLGGRDTAVSMVEEVHATLTTLCVSPALTFLTSPCVLQFADTLWHTCWTWLVRFSHDTFALQKLKRGLYRGADADGMWHGPLTISEAADLDALVTCRVMLRATHHIHLLAAELMEYLCHVYVPALKTSADGSSCLVTTPVEALERQQAMQDAASESVLAFPHLLSLNTTDTGGSLESKGEFNFSLSSLRAYEVLCLSRFGKEERRGPCVWERWMKELAHGDAILQEHRLVHWQSRLV